MHTRMTVGIEHAVPEQAVPEQAVPEHAVPEQAVPEELCTPVRMLCRPDTDGVAVLRNTGSTYRDGGEERVLEILRTCSDLGSLSDEPLSHATNWPERYHLSPARANVVRPLEIPAHARVLEIGAGCGAVTRYLGEVAGVVDALEPVRSRAACIAERTRDLDSVRVFVGEIADIPALPSYDVIVVVGVLEYVGGGSSQQRPYQEFLAAVARRLVQGGSLVLAIENKLGVKYLVGAPEDHSDREFDSLEGYPHGAPARTFDGRSLTALLAGAGLQADTAVAFPDYKMTRAVLRPDLATPETESLLYRVPNFPSPDWVSPREPLADERLVWRAMVEAGLAGAVGNSFVMLAGKGAASTLWPPDVAGVFYSVGRRGRFVTETRIDVSETPTMRRRRLSSQDLTGGHLLVVGDSTVVQGEDLMDLIVDVDDQATVTYLNQWASMVTTAPGRPPLDLVPHNIVVSATGELRFIDDEWRADFATPQMVLRRGVLYVGIKLAEGGRARGRWSGCQTFHDAVTAMGSVVGLPEDGSWIPAAIKDEADLQVAVTTSHGTDRSNVIAVLQSILARDLHSPVDLRGRLRTLREQVSAAADTAARCAAAEAALAVARSSLDEQAQRLVAMEHKLDGLTELTRRATDEADLMRQTVSWRVTAPLRSARRGSALTRRAWQRDSG
jgi:SAM-dependent methyltransferase